MSKWTFFSNHGHVLVCLASDPEARLRDVAADVGITERAVQKIVRDLQDDSMVVVTKHGRRNRYRIQDKKALRHELEAHCTLADLVSLVVDTAPESEPITPTRSIEPRPVQFKPRARKPEEPKSDTAERDKPESAKSKPVQPAAPESEVVEPTERQQGSLF